MFCLQSLHVCFLWIKVHPLFCLTQFYQSMFSVRPFFEHFFPFSCHLWRTMIQWWSVSSKLVIGKCCQMLSRKSGIILWIENIVCSELTLCESFEDIKWQFCFLFPQAVIKSDRKSYLITVVHLVPVLWKGVKTRRGPWWLVLDYSVSKDLSANEIFEHRTLWWSGLTDQLWRWSLWSAGSLMTLATDCFDVNGTKMPRD